MRRFVLNRLRDAHQFSGTGIVVEGVAFSDGRVAMRWMTGRARSTVTYDSVADMMEIHSHDDDTVIEWLDPEGADG
jgi:hypothetical protein